MTIGNETSLKLVLFENVQNSRELKAKIIQGTLDATFLDAKLVCVV